MTSEPNQPHDNEDTALTPRHRISLEKLQTQSQEDNLWDLDDEIPMQSEKPPQTLQNQEPIERPGRKPKTPDARHRKIEPHETPAPTPAKITPPSPAPQDPKPEYPTQKNQPQLSDDFTDLDTWDDSAPTAPVSPQSQSPAAPPAPPQEPTPDPAPTDAPAQQPARETTNHGRTIASDPEGILGLQPSGKSELLDDDATGKTTKNRRKTKISLIEKIGIASLAILIIAGAAFFLINSLGSLPQSTNPYQMPSFPVRGEHLQIQSASSFWREPVRSGPEADTVQRDTALIPVIEISATAEHAILRVQFRNSDGAAVGDPVTRTIQGQNTITIPSTAGLEDANTHSAYRTGNLRPWSAEILEAPAGTTAGSAFLRLVDLPISPSRR